MGYLTTVCLQEFLSELIISRHEKRDSQLQELNEMPLYPTEVDSVRLVDLGLGQGWKEPVFFKTQPSGFLGGFYWGFPFFLLGF